MFSSHPHQTLSSNSLKRERYGQTTIEKRTVYKMQASSDRLAEDHDLRLEHSSGVEVISENLEHLLRLNGDSSTHKEMLEKEENFQDAEEAETDEEEGEEGEEEEEEEEFSFMCGGANSSPIAAEDAFADGQIKPIFPLFNQDLLLEARDFGEHLPVNPSVKKVFMEVKRDSSASLESDEISGPYCEWSKPVSAAEGAAPGPEGCKKSNSTGFSKLWRFKELLHRSNSDGRDAFVFLNNHPTTSSSHQTVSSSSSSKKEDKKSGGENEEVNKRKEKVKKTGKKKTASLSAHEVYLKNKAKENDRRKSYLPYRPEVFGFFTNVSGGMSKNVHPF